MSPRSAEGVRGGQGRDGPHPLRAGGQPHGRALQLEVQQHRRHGRHPAKSDYGGQGAQHRLLQAAHRTRLRDPAVLGPERDRHPEGAVRVLRKSRR